MIDIYVVEWSKKQNALHIQGLRLAHEKNLSAFIGDEQMDYIQLYQGPRERCECFMNGLRQRLILRDKSISMRGVRHDNKRD